MHKPVPSTARTSNVEPSNNGRSSNGVHVAALEATEPTERHDSNGNGACQKQPSPPGEKLALDTVRILIADDHQLFRDGLRRLLQSEPGFRVVGLASDGDEVVQLAKRLKPDIILLDVSMPGRGGIDALRELALLEHPTRTLLVTASLDKAEIVTALRLGACGVIFKGTPTTRLFESIRCVMAGQYWVTREGVSDLVKALRTVSPLEPIESPKTFGLTKREKEVVSMVVTGCSNPEIAQRCSISEQTVKHHIGHIFDKLGVSNRLELALFAVNHRLSGSPSEE